MKKGTRWLALLSAATMMGATFAGCGRTTAGLEQIDKTKTQLYVFSYTGGYGSEWIMKVKERYEELHKDTVFEKACENESYEEGKKGVQVYVRADKESTMEERQHIPANRDEVFFAEFCYYQTLLKEGYLADITDAVTGDLSIFNDGDEQGVTVESKMVQEQKDFFGVPQADGKTHYYAIPHYAGYDGITYNVDLFDDRGYYFIDGYEAYVDNFENLSDLFIYEDSDPKSKGPDGKTGVIDGVDYSIDDGLPATYQDFFLLCQYIQSDKNMPIVWNGYAYQSYLNYIVHALAADFDGLDQSMLNFTLDGEATSLGKIVNGQFVADAEPTTITGTNAYELSRQEGKYHALTFLEELLRGNGVASGYSSTAGKYYDDKCLNSTYDHITAQSDYVWGGYDNVTTPTGMLIDGIWWENEAIDAFTAMEDTGAAKKEDRRFAFMPYPKATREKVGEKNVLLDKIYSVAFVKNNIEDWKLPLAIDFLKFVNTYESHIEFTTTTNTIRALNYEIPETEKAKMTYFGRSVLELKERSDVIYPYSMNDNYVAYPKEFQTHGLFWTRIGVQDLDRSCYAFKERKDVNAKSYFSGMYSYYQEQWADFT